MWEVLDDFANIQQYTSQVKTSVLEGDTPTGVGATRFCELAPFGSTSETIREYVPNEKMVIELYDINGLPIKGTMSTFTVKALSEDQTELTFSSQVRPKGGIASGFVGKRLEKRLPKGTQSLLADFARAAEEKTAAA